MPSPMGHRLTFMLCFNDSNTEIVKVAMILARCHIVIFVQTMLCLGMACNRHKRDQMSKQIPVREHNLVGNS